jgi:hypothetical protein
MMLALAPAAHRRSQPTMLALAAAGHRGAHR